MKSIIHKTLIPIYNEMLYVAFDREAAFRQFHFSSEERHSHRDAYGFAFMGTDHKNTPVFALFVEKRNECLSVATVAHECYHIADLIMEKKGIQYHQGSGNEHVAYLIDYLVEKVFDCLELDNQYHNNRSK